MNKTWSLRDDPSNYDDDGNYIDGPPSKVGPMEITINEPGDVKKLLRPVGIGSQAKQHTPGPWKIQDCATCGHPNAIYVGKMTDLESFIAFTQYRDDGAHDANARLIAAAPDLLAALQKAEATLRDGATAFGLFGKLTAQSAMLIAADETARVIAKAEGREG